jgi:hypothetical protein
MQVPFSLLHLSVTHLIIGLDIYSYGQKLVLVSLQGCLHFPGVLCASSKYCSVSIFEIDACACAKRARSRPVLTILSAHKMERDVDSLFFILDASSQDCYDIPRTFPSDRSSSLEGFHNHFVSIIHPGIVKSISKIFLLGTLGLTEMVIHVNECDSCFCVRR